MEYNRQNEKKNIYKHLCILWYYDALFLVGYSFQLNKLIATLAQLIDNKNWKMSLLWPSLDWFDGEQDNTHQVLPKSDITNTYNINPDKTHPENTHPDIIHPINTHPRTIPTQQLPTREEKALKI